MTHQQSLLAELMSDKGRIDIWEIHIPDLSHHEKELFEILDEKEKIRASKFVFPHLTTRFTIGRASLRILLGMYAGMDPREITFSHRVRGKPYLSINPHQIEFNSSDSHEKVLIGISIQEEIGVDIERINPGILSKGLQNTIFTAKELEIFRTHPDQLEAFYCGWTHKEAMLKLLGTGLYIDPNLIDVPLNLASEPNPIHFENKTQFIRSFVLSNEYYVAIASYKPDFNIKKHNFSLNPEGKF